MAGWGWGVQVHKERVTGPRMSLPCPRSVTVPGPEPHLATRIQAEDGVAVTVTRAWLTTTGNTPARTMAEPHGLAPSLKGLWWTLFLRPYDDLWGVEPVL